MNARPEGWLAVPIASALVGEKATFAGDGFLFVLRVSGYEFPALDSGADANWLVGEVELTASSTGSFRGSHDVSLRTDELAAFRDQLARVVERLDGEATLAHLEDQVGSTIHLSHGKGTFAAFVRDHVGAKLVVNGLRTDQSYLQESVRQLDALVDTFPVRGNPFD